MNSQANESATGAGTSVGEAAIIACTEAFNRFAFGADRKQRQVAWDAFRSGWIAAQLHAMSQSSATSSSNQE